MKSRIVWTLAAACVLVIAYTSLGWAGEPISVGLSAPLTGNYSEYGTNWKKAMDILKKCII